MKRLTKFAVLMLAQVLGMVLYGGAHALGLLPGVTLVPALAAGQLLGLMLSVLYLVAKGTDAIDGPDPGDDDRPPDPEPLGPPGDMLWWYDVAKAWQQGPPPSRRERVRRLILESEFGRRLP